MEALMTLIQATNQEFDVWKEFHKTGVYGSHGLQHKKEKKNTRRLNTACVESPKTWRPNLT